MKFLPSFILIKFPFHSHLSQIAKQAQSDQFTYELSFVLKEINVSLSDFILQKKGKN